MRAEVRDFLQMTEAEPHQALRARGVAAPYNSEAAAAIFVSHQWCGLRHPDPDFAQLRVLQEPARASGARSAPRRVREARRARAAPRAARQGAREARRPAVRRPRSFRAAREGRQTQQCASGARAVRGQRPKIARAAPLERRPSGARAVLERVAPKQRPSGA